MEVLIRNEVPTVVRLDGGYGIDDFVAGLRQGDAIVAVEPPELVVEEIDAAVERFVDYDGGATYTEEELADMLRDGHVVVWVAQHTEENPSPLSTEQTAVIKRTLRRFPSIAEQLDDGAPTSVRPDLADIYGDPVDATNDPRRNNL